MSAIVNLSGKQYHVGEKTVLVVDRLEAGVGDTLSCPDLLGGAPLTAKVVEHFLDRKVVIQRFRNKSRYQRRVGHRQMKTRLEFLGRTKES